MLRFRVRATTFSLRSGAHICAEGRCTLKFKYGEFRRDVNVRPHGGRLQTREKVSSPDRTGPSSPNSSLATPIPRC
jgi:hypothetical protein